MVVGDSSNHCCTFPNAFNLSSLTDDRFVCLTRVSLALDDDDLTFVRELFTFAIVEANGFFVDLLVSICCTPCDDFRLCLIFCVCFAIDRFKFLLLELLVFGMANVADLSTIFNVFPSMVFVVAVTMAAAAAAAALVAERFVLLRSPRTFFFRGTFVRIAACTIT